MNKLILTIAMLVVTMSIANADHQCATPVSSSVFKYHFNHILAMHGDNHRLQDARQFVAEHCLKSLQVKQLATLFHNDRARLEFAKAAYLTTWDKNNFYDVYDAFNHFSNAFRLHDFVLAQRAHASDPFGTIPTSTPPPTTVTHTFPEYDYPSHVGYTEEMNCDRPTAAWAFNGLVGKIIRQPNDVEKIKVASRFAQENCLATAQIMKIGSMVETERNRLIFLETVFNYAFDVMNYGYASQLFSSDLYRAKFEHFLTGGDVAPSPPPTAAPPLQPPCSTSPAQFVEIKQHIDAQSFNNTRITVGKQVIAARACLTAKQIAELVLLFAFEDGKLDIAKFAYDYCIDKQNYFLVNNSFTFESSIELLNQYIASRP